MDKIEQELYFNTKLLKNIESPYYSTYIEGIVYNLYDDLKTWTTHKFIFDTGADITILNRQFASLFKATTPIIDYMKIRYGSGLSHDLPVYNVSIKIKGVVFPMPAAFDKNMSLTSLLGHFGFLDNLQHYGVSMKRRKLTIIK